MFLEALTSVTTGPTGNVLKWDSDGYYMVGEDDWEDIEIEASFIYKGGSIGLIPRYYSQYAFMYFTIGKTMYETDSELGVEEEKDMALFSFYRNEEEITLGTKELGAPLTVDAEYTIKAVIQKNNYQIFVNDVMQFNVEYNGGLIGNTGVYASIENLCQSISVRSDFPDQWASNVESVNGATIYASEKMDEDKTVRLENPATSGIDLYIEQIVSLSTNKDLIYYGSYFGECRMALRYLNGAQANTEVSVVGVALESWDKLEGKTQAPADCTQVALRFYVSPGKDVVLNDIQIEEGKLPTSYIHNESIVDGAVRDASFLTFPAKGIVNNETGSISMWIKPNSTYDLALGKKYMLFQYGDPVNGITICGIDNTLYAQHGSTSITFNTLPIEKDEWYHIGLTWNAENVSFYVNGVEMKVVSDDLFDGEATTINVGFDDFSDYEVFNGVIDDLIVYKTILDADKVTDIYESLLPVQDSGDMTLRASFDYAIGNFKKTYIEIPNAPEYGSPIIAQKDNGDILRKVSFLDYKTGEYKTWNEEVVMYDGDDFIEVSFDRLDTENFKVNVSDQAGRFLGDPYTVEGKRIYMTLTDQEKELHKDKPLHVQYQLEDSYTVDFNIEAADSFRVEIAKHDGHAINIVYEGNRFSEEKLADMIEMNPLLNPNHEGFLYVSQTVEPITSFKVKVTPTDLPADGLSDGLIIIEPVDSNGNHVCGADLEVTATYGVVYPSLEMESARLRQIAGRYLYRYVAPRRITTVEGEIQKLIDSIRIIDKDTGIGVEKYITLCLYDDYEMKIPEVKDKGTVSPELMGAYLLEKVVEHIGTPVTSLPVELRPLNFTQSGTVNIKDVTWIKEKLYTTDLQTMYQNILRYTQER